MDIFFNNLDVLSIGIVIAATGLLGFIAYFNDPRSITNKTFLTFCLLTIAWGGLNFLRGQIREPMVAFWLLRVSIFIATWHAFFLFQLLYVFPDKQFSFPVAYRNILTPLVAVTALINLTPLTFAKIVETSADGHITKTANGPGIALFSGLVLFLVIGGITILIKKIRKSGGTTTAQMRAIVLGISLTFTLILIFNFIFPAFLNNSEYTSLGAWFIFPFILGVSYSIFRHGFLSIKVISTEILTFILAIVILLEVITSHDSITLLYRSSLFLLVVASGVLLVKSVLNEVRQREQLQALTRQLADVNQRLKALDQARSEFITIASHQLRTPPATIKWYLSSLLGGDYGKLPAEQKEILTKAERTNNSQISLIEDMLNVSRIERGKMEFLFEPADLLSLAQLTCEQLLPIAREKHLELAFLAPATKPPKVMADKEKIRQVMNNLIDNAIKYTKAGKISVTLSATPTEIVFSVSDTGKGFSLEEHRAMFEKFSRGKESIKHSAGLGLGLYVAKVIIDQHKGKISAESKGEGFGSTFSFTLPVHNGLKATSLVDFAQR